VGNGALRHVQKLRDVADAHLMLEEHIQDPDPGFVPEHFVEFAQGGKDALGEHLIGYDSDDLRVNMDKIAFGGDFGIRFCHGSFSFIAGYPLSA
jgi:hypothetical protein